MERMPRKNDLIHCAKMLVTLAALTALLIAALFVSSFLVPAQRNGLAVMILPCVILLIPLCLLSRSIDASLKEPKLVTCR